MTRRLGAIMSEPEVRVHVCLTPGGRATADRGTGAITVPVDVYLNGLLLGSGPLVQSRMEAELMVAAMSYALGPGMPTEPHGMVD
jgi:hypothetical protein